MNCSLDPQSIVAGVGLASLVWLAVVMAMASEARSLTDRIEDAEAAEAHIRFRLIAATDELASLKNGLAR